MPITKQQMMGDIAKGYQSAMAKDKKGDEAAPAPAPAPAAPLVGPPAPATAPAAAAAAPPAQSPTHGQAGAYCSTCGAPSQAAPEPEATETVPMEVTETGYN